MLDGAPQPAAELSPEGFSQQKGISYVLKEGIRLILPSSSANFGTGSCAL